MTPFDEKICDVFPGVTVRKDLVKEVKGNAIVPSYVLEYLLGQYCTTTDEATIQAGIESVKKVLKSHYVHRDEAGAVRSLIKERGQHKVIDKVFVELNDKADVYEASFFNLGIKKVLVPGETIRKHPKLLVNGIWCICGLEYTPSEDRSKSPWILQSLKPIQLSSFDREAYLEGRAKLTTEEWIDLLVQSMGYNPQVLSMRNKLFMLMRLVPFCERNFNLIELGPKGTGKSHIYSEFSPHGILLSGGEVTVAKLFVNNNSGKIGLVGYWDAIAFDEFAGKMKKPDKALVDIMKNYMANKNFSRGIDVMGAEASMVFVGNTQHNLPYMLKHSDLFDELPAAYHDSAFLDRVHFYLPGWEIENLRAELFSNGYGFVVDYLAEVLRAFRDDDRSGDYKEFFTLDESVSVRDRDGIHKTMSGLMKVIFPGGGATENEMRDLLKFAMEGRKRVKDQIMRFDTTYSKPEFRFTDGAGEVCSVKTLEETEYPQYYDVESGECEVESGESQVMSDLQLMTNNSPLTTHHSSLTEGHRDYPENTKGISYKTLFLPYVQDAKKVTIVDPYLRTYWQLRNLMDFITMLIEAKRPEDEIELEIVTSSEEGNPASRQEETLAAMATSVLSAGVHFSYRFDSTAHDRSITTDTGWKILLGRGLDIFQVYDGRNTFALENSIQSYRPCKAFTVSYHKI